MTIPEAEQDYHFAWEGAPASLAWRHLRVIELCGEESLSEPFWFEIDLHRDAGAPDVSARELIGARAALCFRTRTEPPRRMVHGVVASAVELGDVDDGDGAGRYRVTLRPPSWQSHLLEGAHIHIEKTIRAIVDATLRRIGLTESTGAPPSPPGGLLESYTLPALTYGWRLSRSERVTDPAARGYCVQYFEPDLAFVSRLLEEEGISYHYEHGEGECRLVLTDFDQGRMPLDPPLPLGPALLGREIPRWHDGARMRPRAVHLDDYDPMRPEYDLGVVSPAGPAAGLTRSWPGRYRSSRESGALLAAVREQRFDSERRWAHGESRCRILGAGSVFRLEHPKERLGGSYLVTAVRHRGRERGWFADRPGLEPYEAEIECLRCDGPDGDSAFRPPQVTPRPRIYGLQTAVVTAEPEALEAEIDVADLGCVRVRYHWDIEAAARLAGREPTSVWIRVSQLFAGASHGALWHPRVGEEVIVEHGDGDPDRPLVTGRVYNGQRRPHVSCAQRPTYSAIHSLTSPYNGNYHLISFDDLQGEELFLMHASRDMRIDIERNYTRNTKAHDAINAGSQSISVGSWQTISVGTEQTITVGTNQSINVGASQAVDIGGDQTVTIGGSQGTSVDGTSGLAALVSILERAPTIKIHGTAVLHAKGNGMIMLESDAFALVKAPDVTVDGSGTITLQGGDVVALGGQIYVSGAEVVVNGSGSVKIEGGTVDISGGVVNIKGGAINLNC